MTGVRHLTGAGGFGQRIHKAGSVKGKEKHKQKELRSLTLAQRRLCLFHSLRVGQCSPFPEKDLPDRTEVKLLRVFSSRLTNEAKQCNVLCTCAFLAENSRSTLLRTGADPGFWSGEPSRVLAPEGGS